VTRRHGKIPFEPRALGLDSDLDYCLDQLRRLDRDRYLTVLAAPADAAADLAVLYALNLELAIIRDSVSEPMLARIRLQWWREAVTEILDGKPPRRHAVLTPLAALAARRPLDRARIERMIEAREREIDDEPPADMDALLAHAEDTSVSLLALAAAAAGLDPEAQEVAAVIRHVGIGFALAGTARATLHLAGRRRTMLPAALLARHGVSLDRLYDLKPQPELSRAIAEIAALGRRHVEDAKRHRAPAGLLPALRIGTLARAQLARLERRGYDLFDPRSIEAAPLDIWRIAGQKLIGSW